MQQRVLITGGAGFIGSALTRFLVAETDAHLCVLDKLTYAGHTASLGDALNHPRVRFVQGDINDANLLATLLREFQPTQLMHLAAESHVDRSIDGPREFIDTNIVGTFNLLQAALAWWQGQPNGQAFLFHHISTDEVFGSLGDTGLFQESTPYDPRSPYSASKAASDHLVRAWHHTYGLPVVLTNCSNNYGPYQFPEKLIPLTIARALKGDSIPIYGDGGNVRDWLYVDDHVRALWQVVTQGDVGHTYNIGGFNERTNLEVAENLCDLLQSKAPLPAGVRHFRDLITFVDDRPGHDRRYAIDASKIQQALGWQPQETFDSGLAKTVDWYLANRAWVAEVADEAAIRRRGL